MGVKRIIGLDLSLTATGYADDLGPPLVLVSKRLGMERLAWFRDEATMRCAAFCKTGPFQHDIPIEHWSGADVVVIEGYSMGTARQQSHAHALGELGGVVRLALAEARKPVVDVPPGSLKKFATGKGNANKVAMGRAAERAGYDGPDDDNAIDAWWLMQMGWYALAWGEPRAGEHLARTAYRDEAVAKVVWPGA